jgi:hypothetical protein
VGSDVIAATTALAAGAILAMLVGTMIPEAFETTHEGAGLISRRIPCRLRACQARRLAQPRRGAGQPDRHPAALLRAIVEELVTPPPSGARRPRQVTTGVAPRPAGLPPRAGLGPEHRARGCVVGKA